VIEKIYPEESDPALDPEEFDVSIESFVYFSS